MLQHLLNHRLAVYGYPDICHRACGHQNGYPLPDTVINSIEGLIHHKIIKDFS